MNNEQLWRIKRTGNQYSGRFEKTKEIKKRRNKTKETERNEAKYLKQWVSKKMRTSIALVEAFNFFFGKKNSVPFSHIYPLTHGLTRYMTTLP